MGLVGGCLNISLPEDLADSSSPFCANCCEIGGLKYSVCNARFFWTRSSFRGRRGDEFDILGVDGRFRWLWCEYCPPSPAPRLNALSWLFRPRSCSFLARASPSGKALLGALFCEFCLRGDDVAVATVVAVLVSSGAGSWIWTPRSSLLTTSPSDAERT